MRLTLRPATTDDIELFYVHQQDPSAIWMAAFTSAELGDREVFDARWRRILRDPTVEVRTVLVDEVPVGHVLRYESEGRPEVSYWIGREHWGKGYATEAVRLLLVELPERPVLARAAQDNYGSLAVLAHNGFVITGADSAPANGRGAMVKEYVLTLDR